jgi:hypothetical protein
MTDFQTFVARVGGHWIHLRQSPHGWAFELWGEYPTNCNFGKITEWAAKEAASAVAKEYLVRRGVALAAGLELSWRLAVRYTAA